MIYIGIDVHKKNLQVCTVNEDGERLSNGKVANAPESVREHFMAMERPASAALEATHNWGMLYDMLEGMGFEVHVCHTKEAKLIGLANVKTDKVDAYKLATLLRVGLLPEAYVPTAAGRELRELVRARASLKAASTRLKNQVHAILRARWVKSPYADTFGKAGRRFLADLGVEESYKTVIRTKLAVLDSIEGQVRLLDEKIQKRAHLDKRAMIAMTAPGFGEFRSVMLLAEVETIRRFDSPDRFVSFIGLNPSESSSGERVRRGRITKEGSRWLRWIFVEAAHSAINEEGKIRELYLRVSERRGLQKGIVAAARELAVSMYWMLTRMEPYRASGSKRWSVSTSEAR
jgi:transposase